MPERFKSLVDGNRHPEILSTAPGAAPAARAAFLALAERGELPHVPSALRALAAERPSSDLLLHFCWDMLDKEHQRNDDAMVNAEVGLILRDHFSGNAELRQELVERFEQAPGDGTRS